MAQHRELMTTAARMPVVPPLSSPAITVVVPAYRCAARISGVLARIPMDVRHIIVVDDASPDELPEVLASITDPRVIVVRHPVNRGVGGAVKTGFERALELGAAVVVKVDGDGQMDPDLIPAFVAPILDGRADLSKGNRFADLRHVRRMPVVRRLGNLALSFLVKAASGYWSAFDPTNGYIALSDRLLGAMSFDQLDEGYFFEISLLSEAYLARGRMHQVPMVPVYDGEISSLRPSRVFFEFLPKLCARTLRRIGLCYFLRDFNVASVFITFGLLLTLFGTAWSIEHWVQSVRTGIVATTGTVMIGVLAIVLGFQLLLQAVVLDVESEPERRSS